MEWNGRIEHWNGILEWVNYNAKKLSYRIAGYIICRVKLSQMPSKCHEPVVFTDVLFAAFQHLIIVSMCPCIY